MYTLQKDDDCLYHEQVPLICGFDAFTKTLLFVVPFYLDLDAYVRSHPL